MKKFLLLILLACLTLGNVVVAEGFDATQYTNDQLRSIIEASKQQLLLNNASKDKHTDVEISLTERLLNDEEIKALSSDTADNMRKLISRPADAIALLNACIVEDRFANIIDGSQSQDSPGSNVYICQSGWMRLTFANNVDPKDFNLMVAYLLADDFDAGVLMGLPAGGPNSAICYIKSGGAFQLFDASAVIKHGRHSSFPFKDARVEQLQDYVDNVKQKLKYRILFSLPGGAGTTYTDFGTYVSIGSMEATVYWSAEN